MPCYRPLRGYRAKYVNPETGKRPMVFSVEAGLPGSGMPLPCGHCIGCRLDYSRQWAARAMHEKQLHEANSFITLTYAPENLPKAGSLVPKDFTDFMKRLRRRRPPRSVHYLMCGEYGSRTRRPHYHALLFGVRFPDQRYYNEGAGGSVLHTSAELADLWPSGFSTVGEITFESAAYVARYCVKKRDAMIGGSLSFYGERRYEYVDVETFEVMPYQQEYGRMSLKPAIGKEWFKRFGKEVYPSDEVIVQGRQMKPPKYYDSLLEGGDPELLAQVKAKRLGDALERAHDSTSRRLREREEVKIAQTKLLKRGLE